jgi:hypothetical protein
VKPGWTRFFLRGGRGAKTNGQCNPGILLQVVEREWKGSSCRLRVMRPGWVCWCAGCMAGRIRGCRLAGTRRGRRGRVQDDVGVNRAQWLGTKLCSQALPQTKQTILSTTCRELTTHSTSSVFIRPTQLACSNSMNYLLIACRAALSVLRSIRLFPMSSLQTKCQPPRVPLPSPC